MKLPNEAILVVHRSDGSGTTYIFTDFLSHVSPEWKTKVGAGKSVEWPAPSSVGGKGNEGVAGLVRQTPNAIGYVELAYLLQNEMTYGQLQNKGGKLRVPLDCHRSRGCGHQARGIVDGLLHCRRHGGGELPDQRIFVVFCSIRSPRMLLAARSSKH